MNNFKKFDKENRVKAAIATAVRIIPESQSYLLRELEKLDRLVEVETNPEVAENFRIEHAVLSEFLASQN